MRAKMLAAMALVMMVLGGAALAEDAATFAVPLQLPGRTVLIGQDGTELTQGREYLSIESIADADTAPQDELFIARPMYDEVGTGLALLMDSKGQELTDATYDYLLQENGLIRYQKNGLQGVMDRELKSVVPCRYTMLVPNGEGGYLGIDGVPYDDEPDGVYYVDGTGKESPTGALVLSGLGEFAEGLCTATSAQSGRVGYLDAKGNWAIPAQLEYGGTFHGGRAEACIESGYGVIDRQGNWLLTPKYALVSTGFGDGNIILASQDETAVYMIDPDSYQIKKTFTGDQIYFGAYFDRNYVVLYMADKVQLIDEDGNVALETVAEGNFDAYYQMGERVIMRDGAWGEVNAYLMDAETGEEIAGPYRELTMLTTDEAGAPYFAFSDFQVMEASSGGEDSEIFEVPDTRQGGTIDGDGNVVIPMGTFMGLEDAGHGLLRAETLTELGLVNLHGQWVAKYPKDTGEE